MTYIEAMPPVISLPSLADLIAPRRFIADPFGLVSGYRAYLVYTFLSNRTDAELHRLGLERRDISRATTEAVFNRKPA